MKTVNEKITDAFIERQVYVLQYSQGLSNRTVDVLKATNEKLEKTIYYYASRLQGKILASKRSQQNVKRLKKEVAKIRSEAWREVKLLLEDELQLLAFSEVKFVKDVLEKNLPFSIAVKTPTNKDIRDLVVGTSYSGKKLREWTRSAEINDIDRIVSAVKIGVTQRDANVADIVKRVMGTKSLKYKDGAVKKAWNGTDALAFTSTASVKSEATTAVSKKNQFFLTSEQFLATLDQRTTPICIDYDGKVFKLDRGPNPPLHFRCRSIRIPHVSQDSFVDRAFDPSTETTLLNEYTAKHRELSNVTNTTQLSKNHKTVFNGFARKRRGELIGHVPDKVKYGEWLKGRSVQFQNEVMGVKRAQRFRKGDLEINKFISRKGSWLTIEQLKAKGILTE